MNWHDGTSTVFEPDGWSTNKDMFVCFTFDETATDTWTIGVYVDGMYLGDAYVNADLSTGLLFMDTNMTLKDSGSQPIYKKVTFTGIDAESCYNTANGEWMLYPLSTVPSLTPGTVDTTTFVATYVIEEPSGNAITYEGTFTRAEDTKGLYLNIPQAQLPSDANGYAITIKEGECAANDGSIGICILEDCTFYVLREGISFAVPLAISYQNCEETADGWKIVANNSPALGSKGTIGSAVATLQIPGGSSAPITIEKVKAGAVSSELNYYLDKSVIGTEMEVGTTLTIEAGNLSETAFTTNNLELLWDGETWTDQKNLDSVIGDANGDKVLDAKDVLRYKKALANVTDFASDYIPDLNKDASTDEFDIIIARNMVIGIPWKDIAFDCDIHVTSPVENETVYPYVEKVYQFLTTENADIWDYYVACNNLVDGSLKDIIISWEGLLTEEVAKYVDKYVVEYATKSDFSDAISVSVDAGQNSVGINNLYKASDYYVRVTAYAGVIALGQTEPVAFQTTDIGPRVMTVDGIFNVRDLGGYMTESGKRTVQGLLYRGCEMDGTHEIALTEEGDEVMSNLMGIKYDMDFRGLFECNYVTESPISSATKVHHIIGGYTDVFGSSYKNEIRSIFAAFADKNNYPIYFHCWGGADRTGTISFLVNALCGVSEKELIQDYEFTSYSIFGVRSDNWTGYKFDDFLAQLKTYEGDTLSAKTENYLLSIGVTADEIYNIRAIMLGETPL